MIVFLRKIMVLDEPVDHELYKYKTTGSINKTTLSNISNI